MSKCKPSIGSGLATLISKDVRVSEQREDDIDYVVIRVPVAALATDPDVQAVFQDIVAVSALEQA